MSSSDNINIAIAEGSDTDGNGQMTRLASAWGALNSNGGGIEMGPVMGADSWPALGEAAPRSSPPPADLISVPAPQAPVVAVAAVANPNPNSNRHRPGNRGGGLQINGGPNSPPMSPASGEVTAGQGQEPSPRDMQSNRNNSNWDHGSGSRGSGFVHNRSFNRRGNNGGGGGGPHNNPRHVMPPAVRGHHPRPQIIRPPPPPLGAAPFTGPLTPVRPFVGPPMGFAEIPPVFYVQAPPAPFVAAHPVAPPMPPAMLLNTTDYLRDAVKKQIEYYFSNDNLCKDVYLRKLMDDQGWVSVSVIANFNRVKHCTNNIPNSINYILDSVRASELVEVQGEKIRRRGDWMLWLLNQSNINTIENRMQGVMLEDQ